MAKNLLIVESPAKAKTIKSFLGKDFAVASSYGHIRDLIKGNEAIDVNNNFAQHYEVPADKRAVVADLKKLAHAAETVWLASDEDREGEAISWHLFETLNLKHENTRRIVFHEITKPAILSAIASPRQIDYDLVHAQQARRVLDRLVGFELSGVLWKKIKGNLSAGRVQSVAVRLIVDRERQINAFNSTSAFKVDGNFAINNTGNKLAATLNSRFKSEADAHQFLEAAKYARFTVDAIEVRPAKRTPAAPFTTSTLQQEAARKLGFSVDRTMRVAQNLYEQGKITYMRTDSVNLSDEAMGAAYHEINTSYGARYHKKRRFTNKSKGAQEAHEAIRPTYFSAHTVEGDAAEKRLYELIWKRAIASQMADAELERTTITVNMDNRPEQFTAEGEVIKFDGFLKVYFESVNDDDSEQTAGLLPAVKRGDSLALITIEATERFTKAVARYNEASLVKKLEELGIGRPSTYAPTISTIQKREYVVKEDRPGKPRDVRKLLLDAEGGIISRTEVEVAGAEKAKLFPTDIGEVVTDFLVQHFDKIVDYNFTASVEEQFDEIAQGQKNWTGMMHDFYNPFHTEVLNTIEHADRATGERLLGQDPVTGKNVFAKVAKFGPVIQIGDLDAEEKPRYASLGPTQSVGTITLEEGLALFKLPFNLADYKGKPVSVNTGRFGPYIKWGDVSIQLPKGQEPLFVTDEIAQQLVNEKEEANRPIAQYKDAPVTRGTGRFGPFIKWNGMYINVPKKYNFDNLTPNDISELIDAKVTKEAGKYIKQWPEEQVSIENGRWGAFIRYKKLMLKIMPNVATGKKYEPAEIQELELETVKAMIEEQAPGTFTGKKTPATKKAPKSADKKAAAKSTGRKK